MKRIGIIGLGRLGGALVRGLDRAGGYEILGYNRSPEKGRILADQVQTLTVCGSVAQVLDACTLVFIWMKKSDAVTVLEENRALVARRRNLLVSCTAGVPLADYTDRWAETLPNINMPAGHGITLISFSSGLAQSDRELLREVLEAVGVVHELPAGEVAFYSALCSCGPALYATMLETMADTLAERRGYDRGFYRRMTRETVLGTMLLQELDGIEATEVVARVAHPGGPSEAGTEYLRRVMPEVFQGMLQAMKKW